MLYAIDDTWAYATTALSKMKMLPVIRHCRDSIIPHCNDIYWLFFSKKSEDQFTSGHVPRCAIGLSIYLCNIFKQQYIFRRAGKAFGANWNAFAFSLSMPLAAVTTCLFQNINNL